MCKKNRYQQTQLGDFEEMVMKNTSDKTLLISINLKLPERCKPKVLIIDMRIFLKIKILLTWDPNSQLKFTSDFRRTLT